MLQRVNWCGVTHTLFKCPLGQDPHCAFPLLSSGNSKCKVEVPVASIDIILADWQASQSDNKQKSQLSFGGLFATKIDIEGAELEAIKSASLTFADSLQRPCQLILEMKTNDSYTEAFRRIFNLGYTGVINVDNGRTGEGSYPPIRGHYA
jgi:hypothetical protein